MSLSRRLSEIHSRTHLLRRSTIPAALKLIHDAGLTTQPSEGGAYVVAEKFEIYPAIGMWRALDGSSRGYGARSLIAVAKA